MAYIDRNKEAPRKTLLSRLEIGEYIVDKATGVEVPQKWSISFHNNRGDKTAESICELVTYELNGDFDPKSFSLYPFPEGTLVLNDIDGTKGWQRSDSVELIGSKREVPGCQRVQNGQGSPVSVNDSTDTDCVFRYGRMSMSDTDPDLKMSQ